MALADVVAAIAQAGNPDRTVALVGIITDPVEPDLTEVLRAAVAAVKDGAEAFSSTNSQAQVLGYLATVIAQVGDPDGAGRFFASALSLIDAPNMWWVKTVSNFFPSIT